MASSPIQRLPLPNGEGRRINQVRHASDFFVYRGLAPVAAWYFARVLVTYRARQGLYTLSASSWVRWDSSSYIAIAQHGYTFHRCAAGERLIYRQTLCGNAAWFPGYPLLLRLFGWFGAPAAQTGAAISAALLMATFVVLWNGFLLELGWYRAVVLLILAASFPGLVYGFAVYPMSLVLFALMAALLAARHERRMLMITSVGIAVFAYPQAAVLIPVVVLYLALLPGSSAIARLTRAALGVLLAVPLLVIGVWHAISLGHYDAFLLQEKGAGVGLRNPLASLWTVVVTRHATIQRLPGNRSLAVWIACQTAVVALIVVVSAVATVLHWQRAGHIDHFEAFALSTMLALWLLPLATVIGTGLYRREFVLFPVIVLLRRVPLPTLSTVLGACLLVTYEVSGFFFVTTFAQGGLI